MVRKNFKESLDTYVFTTKYVLKEGSPIVYASHDSDGDWQFLGPEDNLREEDAMVVALNEILDYDSSIILISDLPIGKEAVRNSLNDDWKIL
jgi:hypothetical protein